jgi:hypothetical protein
VVLLRVELAREGEGEAVRSASTTTAALSPREAFNRALLAAAGTIGAKGRDVKRLFEGEQILVRPAPSCPPWRATYAAGAVATADARRDVVLRAEIPQGYVQGWVLVTEDRGGRAQVEASLHARRGVVHRHLVWPGITLTQDMPFLLEVRGWLEVRVNSLDELLAAAIVIYETRE